MSASEPEIGDAFGAALRDNCGSEPSAMHPHIIERDDGFVDVADTAQYFAAPDEWNALDRWALEGVSGRVLDIGAGAGRHSIFLQQRRCEVTAVDVSPLAIQVCTARGVRNTFAGTIEQFAATNPAPFDAFVLLGNNLGLLRDAGYAPRFLELLATIARPGAMLRGTCLDPYKTSDPEHLAHHERNREAGRMGGQLRIRVRYRSLTTEWWDYLFMSSGELRQLVRGTRWSIDEIRDDGALFAVHMRLT